MQKNPEFIELEMKEGIGWIRLNRPEVLNALNRRMVAEIVEALETYERDDQVKVVVLTGNGRAFAAGADIKEMAEETPVSLELLNQFADWDRILLFKKPLIAAVNGMALGGGFELALACDVIFASERAKFGFPEVNLGVMPGAGGTQWLTKHLGKRKALEWLWSGDMMTVDEAYHYGAVNRIIAPEILEEETTKFARKLVAQAPLSLRLIKEAVNEAVDHPIKDGMLLERKNFYLLFASEDQTEGMKAFMEKRKPEFKGE